MSECATREPRRKSQTQEFDRHSDDATVVLIVGMHHHHEIGIPRQRFAIAGLLVAAVAGVTLVLEHGQAEFSR